MSHLKLSSVGASGHSEEKKNYLKQRGGGQRRRRVGRGAEEGRREERSSSPGVQTHISILFLTVLLSGTGVNSLNL